MLCICEANLEGMCSDRPFSIKGYKSYCPRLLDTQKYTRVIVLVKTELDCVLRDEYMQPGQAAVWLQLKPSGKEEKFLIGSLYREFKIPTTTDTHETLGRSEKAQKLRLQEFGSNLCRVTAENKNVLLMGDINLDLSKLEYSNYLI